MKIYQLTFDGVYNARQTSHSCDFITVVFSDLSLSTVAYIPTMEDVYSVLTWSDYDPDIIGIRGATRKEIRRFLARQEQARRLFEAEPPFYTADEMEAMFE